MIQIEQLSQLHYRCWSETYDTFFSSENTFFFIRPYSLFLKYWHNLKEKENVFLTYFTNKNKNPVGFIVASYIGNNCFLNSFYVEKKYQKKGIGKIMFKKLIEDSKKKKSVNLYIEVILGLSSNIFYSKIGAKLISQRNAIIDNKIVTLNKYEIKL